MGWVWGKAKTRKQDDTNSSIQSGYDIHMYPQRVNRRPRQTCTDSWRHIKFALQNWSPPLVPFYQSQIYIIDKMHSGKADQLTLVRGGSEHAWLVQLCISWGNKMNFSVYANMLGFCSDNHIIMNLCFTGYILVIMVIWIV